MAKNIFEMRQNSVYSLEKVYLSSEKNINCRQFVQELAAGRGNFYDGWMKNPYSAMISCNDGFRPVSFFIEQVAGS